MLTTISTPSARLTLTQARICAWLKRPRSQRSRTDEELGRTELLRSRALGLHAYSSASWLVNAVLCVAVGAAVAIVSAA